MLRQPPATEGLSPNTIASLGAFEEIPGDEAGLDIVSTFGLAPDGPNTVTADHLILNSAHIVGLGQIERGGGKYSLITDERTISIEPEFVSLVTGLIKDSLSKITYLAPRREAITFGGGDGKTHLSYDTTLKPDGTNLTNVIAYLLMHDRPTLERIEAVVREAFPAVARISPRPFGQHGASTFQVQLHVDYTDGRQVPLSLCGTGIEQLLVVATGVLTAESSRTFLIDEPHAYLHPHAERTLIRLIDAHPEHQFVIATHSGPFLNAKPISQARLITQDGSLSRIAEIESASALLDELGMTPADLWLADSLLWVEGASEEAILRSLADSLADASTAGVQIRAVPDTSRFASKRQSLATFRFCEAIIAATRPLPVTALFLFDRDEKTEAHIRDIATASAGRAVFLPVREIENLLLDVASIHTALVSRAASAGFEPPNYDAVAAIFDSCIADVNNNEYYKNQTGLAEGDVNAAVGSAVLRRLYWESLTVEYDKVSDGRQLALVVLKQAPLRLKPLLDVLERLRGQNAVS